MQHVKNHPHGELARGKAIRFQITRNIEENLVDRIAVNILWSNVFEINIINLRADRHIARHLRRGNKIINRKLRPCPKLRIPAGGTRQLPAGSGTPARRVDRLNSLHNFKQPRSAGKSPRLERRGNGQADRLIRAALIRHHKIRRHWVKTALHTLDRGVKRLQVDGKIRSVLHCAALFPSLSCVPESFQPFLLTCCFIRCTKAACLLSTLCKRIILFYYMQKTFLSQGFLHSINFLPGTNQAQTAPVCFIFLNIIYIQSFPFIVY